TVKLITDEVDNFARLGLGTSNTPYLMTADYFHMAGGQEYTLVFIYRITDVPEIDLVEFRGAKGIGEGLLLSDFLPREDLETKKSGQWEKKIITFYNENDMNVRLILGTDFSLWNTQRGILDIKKPYLTTTNNREWLPHPDDDTQNVS